MSALQPFVRLPLGGVDRRSLVETLRTQGPGVAAADLARDRARLSPSGLRSAPRSCVLLLGGSNGVLRGLAIQLALVDRVPVYAVHYDSEKLQIGGHHARAIVAAAECDGAWVKFRNADATKPETVTSVVAELRAHFDVVHLVNGIAAGAPKRFAEFGPAQVPDLDVAFDPVRQTPDFSSIENLRRIGLVAVDVATETDLDRTYRAMGRSSDAWVAALAAAGLLVRDESVVAFTDYDHAPDDPVYARGPLATAKRMQRETLGRAVETHGVRAVRVCYPPMATTAIGAIPGGLLMYAATMQLARARGGHGDVVRYGSETASIFAGGTCIGELRLDGPAVAVRDEVTALVTTLTPENFRERLGGAVGS